MSVERCTTCDGRGSFPRDSDQYGIHCLSCDGAGWVTTPEPRDARTALEAALDGLELRWVAEASKHLLHTSLSSTTRGRTLEGCANQLRAARHFAAQQPGADR